MGVVHVLEGSVRRSVDNLRVTAQLIRADSGHRLWSQTFDRKADDILKIQDGITRAVVSALKGGLKASLLPGSTGTKNAEAYSLYFQANQQFRQGLSDDDTRRALAQVKKSLEIDPQFAQALALQSAIFDDLGMQVEARKSADKALELNPNLAVAHFALARLSLSSCDLPGSEKELGRALELDPDLAGALDATALIESFRGQFTQPIEKFQRVVVMDPVNPQRYAKLASVDFFAGRYPEASAAMHRAMELQPGFADPHNWSSTILFAQGKFAAALAELDLAALANLIEVHSRDEAYGIASVYASRGDADHAFEWLDRAYAQREFQLYWVKINPDFKPVRNDPRFNAFLLKLHLI